MALWDKLAIHKFDGGMGFMNLYAFNVALLGKQGWCFLSQPDTLVAKLFKAKYFPHCDFLEAKVGSNSSYAWRSLCEARALLKKGIKWKIWSGNDIKVWSHAWTIDRSVPVAVNSDVASLDLRVSNLWVSGMKMWDANLVRNLMHPAAANTVLQMPLHGAIKEDGIMWWPRKKGMFSIRSAYILCLEEMLELDHLKVPGNWKKLWDICVPPKVIFFLWRADQDCLPTRTKLNSRGAQCESICSWCSSNFENSWHIPLSCPKAEAVWRKANLWDIISSYFERTDNFRELCFFMLEQLFVIDCKTWDMTLWSIWRSRNLKVWEGVAEEASTIFFRDWNLLQEWSKARETEAIPRASNPSTSAHSTSSKPPMGFVKCNIDASFFANSNQVGIGMSLRDDVGNFIGAKTHWFKPIMDVHLGEAAGLYFAINWMKDL